MSSECPVCKSEYEERRAREMEINELRAEIDFLEQRLELFEALHKAAQAALRMNGVSEYDN